MVSMPLLLRHSKTTVLASKRGRIPKRLVLAGCGYKGPEYICGLQRTCRDWLRFLCLCAIRLTATAAPRVGLCKVCGPLHKAWPTCAALCSTPPKGTGKCKYEEHRVPELAQEKVVIGWTGRLSWFLGHESNANLMAERRNFPQKHPNPQLPDAGFLAASFEAACAGHCQSRMVESTVALLMCYGYSCIPGTIQENET